MSLPFKVTVWLLNGCIYERDYYVGTIGRAVGNLVKYAAESEESEVRKVEVTPIE